MARASAEPVAPVIEGEARDEDPVHLAGISQPGVEARLRYPQGPRHQVGLEVLDLRKGGAAARGADPRRTEQPLLPCPTAYSKKAVVANSSGKAET